MLQRDRQIRTQVHQLADACLFAASFWLAYALRGSPVVTEWINQVLPAGHELEVVPPEMFAHVWWLYFALIPAAPLVLESQGFYNRPAVHSRKALMWPLLRGSLLVTLGIVVLLFFFKEPAPRGAAVCFFLISLVLVWLKEELLMAALHSPMAKAQYKRRVIVAGTAVENSRFRQILKTLGGDEMEVVAEFNLAESSMPHLIELLHEHSASSVLISSKHTNFERVENIIRLCETEGVEAWLVADFFATKIARAMMDYESVENLKLLLMRAEVASPDLPRELEAMGAIVDDVACYKTIPETEDVTGAAASLLESGADWITFTSSSTVEHFHARFDLPALVQRFPQTKLASIGPETTKTIEALGLKPSVEAKPHTMEGLVQAILNFEPK